VERGNGYADALSPVLFCITTAATLNAIANASDAENRIVHMTYPFMIFFG